MPEIEAFELTHGNAACGRISLKPRSIEIAMLHFACSADLPERHANTLNGVDVSFAEISIILHQFHRRPRRMC